MSKALYQQIADSILDQIETGVLEPGARLPSEHALSEQHGVGRNTIRHALSDLAAKGFVEPVQGVGTFVTETHFPKTVEFLYGFSQEMAQRGKTAASKLLEAEIITADPFLARTLRVQLGAEVVFLSRLRLVDGVLMFLRPELESKRIEIRQSHEQLLPCRLDANLIKQTLLNLLLNAEQAVADHVASLADNNATNGALVAIEPSTGFIVAMVGSADFYEESIDGQVNVALRERQPGSSIKPLTYLAAFEQGWTPATLTWDVRTEFPDGANPPYVPRNYDRRWHGPIWG